MKNNKEIEKQVTSGITLWWIDQGRFSEERIISRIKNLEMTFLALFLMQIAIFLLILSRL